MKNEEMDEIKKIQLKTLYESKRINIENIDLKFKIFKMKIYFSNSKQYIKDLEEQIKLRDIIIEKNNKFFYKDKENPLFNLLNNEQISKYKSLSQIKNKNIIKYVIRRNFLNFLLIISWISTFYLSQIIFIIQIFFIFEQILKI
jgi:hypothetical protein